MEQSGLWPGRNDPRHCLIACAVELHRVERQIAGAMKDHELRMEGVREKEAEIDQLQKEREMLEQQLREYAGLLR